MRWQRNNGTEKSEILQNQFTAYVKRAVHNRRTRYLSENSRRTQKETALSEAEAYLSDSKDDLQTLLEYETLRQTLRSMKEKERSIILAHIVEEKNFHEIAVEQGITYKAVTSLYYRVMKKLRLYIEGGESE